MLTAYFFFLNRCLWRCWTRTTTRHWRANRSTGWAWRRIHRHEQPSHASRHSMATSSAVAEAARWSTIWKPAILSRCLTLTPTLVRITKASPCCRYTYLLTQQRWRINTNKKGRTRTRTQGLTGGASRIVSCLKYSNVVLWKLEWNPSIPWPLSLSVGITLLHKMRGWRER